MRQVRAAKMASLELKGPLAKAHLASLGRGYLSTLVIYMREGGRSVGVDICELNMGFEGTVDSERMVLMGRQM